MPLSRGRKFVRSVEDIIVVVLHPKQNTRRCVVPCLQSVCGFIDKQSCMADFFKSAGLTFPISLRSLSSKATVILETPSMTQCLSAAGQANGKPKCLLREINALICHQPTQQNR